MNFARPQLLYLFLLVPGLVLFFWISATRRRSALMRFGNPELLARAGMAIATRVRTTRAVFIILAVTLMVIALAGPQWGASREKIERRGVDVVVAIDTSLSMLAEDVAPSRLKKARQSVARLIDMMKGDRIGIVAFSGAAFTMCPLTLDYNAARMFLDVINTQTVPEPGTNIAEALTVAASNFDEGTSKYKVIILISDGEHLESDKDESPVEVAEELAGDGVVIFTVGIGEPKGSSIPVETTNGLVDKTDRKGNVVITRLDENGLRKVALAASGKYRRLDNRASGDELAQIYAGIAGMDKKTFEEQYQIHYEDRFQWFLGAALLLVALEAMLPDRRRKKGK